MISGFVAQKISMSSLYLPTGQRIAVTTCRLPVLKVTQLKNLDKDGYQAVQVAYGSKKRPDKAVSSKLTKLKINATPAHFHEFDLTSDTQPEIGSEISVTSVFAPGDSLNVTGTSKGHGFAGVIKRYGFHRQPVSGGQSDRVRAPGAIGAQTPGKVVKGKKMPGHYGNVTKTITGLKVISIDEAKKEIQISGSIPGSRNSWLILTKKF
ncbi:50S ribosomal protein L3 [Candidatus Shapirobacteria bacterium RBG_13_44_7]|uniref:50S ribosomal protein L3 n=1 Tax=Candidatus Shapirobacteria bacterium RBG_13_44_7 TaxID=1802149 RepID=A0A1F7SIC4_9BACT|nr:MAG: 50S ribosomal protein L3 [Candidatus Shapirobacteria bacterium RBG_13_44_7]